MREQTKREKRQLRESLRDFTQSLPDAYIAYSNRGIQDNLLALEQWKQAHAVFIYISIGREPETKGAVQAALNEGKTVAVPKSLSDGTMEARVITSLNGLRQGRFGIPEPDDTARLLPQKDIDLVVVPCVAADKQCNRLGHGKGYYDRYLAKIQCPAICLCRARLLQTVLPHDALDRPVDIVITERKCLVRR